MRWKRRHGAQNEAFCAGSGQLVENLRTDQGFCRGECQLCGRWVMVTSDGRLRAHHARSRVVVVRSPSGDGHRPGVQ